MQQVINRLLKYAKLAFASSDVPVACAIIDSNNKILAISKNEKEKHHNPSYHAEVLAISKLCKKIKSCYLNDFIIITTLEPCPMCYQVILEARLKKIIYLSKDYKNGFLNGNINYYNLTKKPLPEIIYLENKNASKLVTDFFKQLRSFN